MRTISVREFSYDPSAVFARVEGGESIHRAAGSGSRAHLRRGRECVPVDEAGDRPRTPVPWAVTRSLPVEQCRSGRCRRETNPDRSRGFVASFGRSGHTHNTLRTQPH